VSEGHGLIVFITMASPDPPSGAGPVASRRPTPRAPRFFSSLRGYQGSWLRGDLIAGLTVWAILVPQALAYASIAGVSPVVGLYAAPGALVLYAALGSSRYMVTGPMAATAALSAATVADLIPAGDGRFTAFTAGLAITAGLAALAAGLVRLGFLANFISQPVLKGFIIGLALTIIVGQLSTLFGIGRGTGDFFEQAWHLVTHLGDTQGLTLLVGTASLALIFGLRRLAPSVPGSLVAVAVGIIAVKAFGLDVPTVGAIGSGLPSFGLPDIGLSDAGGLAAGGIGVMLIAFAEGLGAAKTYAALNHEEIDADRELVALGSANIASGLCSGMVVAGSLSKTAVNVSAGGRSQLSALLAAALAVVALLLLTGLFEDLPTATLAAVVIAAVAELVDVRALVALYNTYTKRLGRQYGWVARPDFIAAIAALLGVLVLGTLRGLFAGIGVSLLLLIYRASRPYVAVLGRTPGPNGVFRDVERHSDARPLDDVVVLRIESGLYFANADNVRSHILDAGTRDGVRAVILDAETTPFVDVSAARMLADTRDELAALGVRLVLARNVGQVRDVLRSTTGDSHLTASYPTIDSAIQAVGAAAAARPLGQGGTSP
jgi:sulfate permease, SulP family